MSPDPLNYNIKYERRTTEIVIRCALFAPANLPTAPPEHEINMREQNQRRRKRGSLDVFYNQLIPLIVEVFIRVIVNCIERYTMNIMGIYEYEIGDFVRVLSHTSIINCTSYIYLYIINLHTSTSSKYG